MSGRGFSYYAPQPSYQASAVAVYIKNAGASTGKILQSAGVLPTGGSQTLQRGPQSTRYGQTGASGTSVSTPTWAGVFSLLSDLRLNAGKAPLGFANPFLYAHPGCLNDIIIGANDGVGCFDASGFPAARGWDAATGLGTPVFGCLAAAALALGLD